MSKIADTMQADLEALGLSKEDAEKKVTDFYAGVVADYTVHVQKHLDAALIENPAKQSEADFLNDVLTRVKEEEKSLIMVVAEKIVE